MNKAMLFCTFWLLVFKVNAFTMMSSDEPKFANPEVVVNVAGNTCAGININTDQLLNFVEEAVDEYWNAVSTCALELKRGAVLLDKDLSSYNAQSGTSLTGAFNIIEDNTILIGCNTNTDSFSSNSTLAVGTIWRNKGLVLVNATPGNQFDSTDNQEKLAIFAHEIGHAFGLGHSGDPVALMYYAIGGKVQERLTIDDYDGCTYLYPHDSPGTCASVSFVDKNNGGGGKGHWLNFILGLMFIGLLKPLIKLFGRLLQFIN